MRPGLTVRINRATLIAHYYSAKYRVAYDFHQFCHASNPCVYQLVVSPLIALMQDQVLHEMLIAALCEPIIV